MKDVLHSQKNSVSPSKTQGSKREATPNEQNMGFTPEQRHQMIAEAAYQRAQKRDFIGGDPENDWYEAEAEVSQLSSQQKASHSEPQH